MLLIQLSSIVYDAAEWRQDKKSIVDITQNAFEMYMTSVEETTLYSYATREIKSKYLYQ